MACPDCAERVHELVVLGCMAFAAAIGAISGAGLTSAGWQNALVDDPASIATERSIVLLRREIQELGGR